MMYVSESFVNGGVLTQASVLRPRWPAPIFFYRWVPVTPQDTLWLPPGGMVL